jgi:hypothetical protein
VPETLTPSELSADDDLSRTDAVPRAPREQLNDVQNLRKQAVP